MLCEKYFKHFKSINQIDPVEEDYESRSDFDECTMFFDKFMKCFW